MIKKDKCLPAIVIIFTVISILFTACSVGSSVDPNENTTDPEIISNDNTYTIDEIIDNIYKNSLEPEEEKVISEDNDILVDEKTDPKYLRRASDLFVNTQINIAPIDSNITEVVFAYYPETNGGKVVLLLLEDHLHSVSRSKKAMLVCNTDMNGNEFFEALQSGISNLSVERVEIIDYLDFLFCWSKIYGEVKEITNYFETPYSNELYPITDDQPFFGLVFSGEESLDGIKFVNVTLDNDSAFQDVYDRFGVQINDR